MELEGMRDVCKHQGAPFPPACRRLLYSLPGNSHCVDCGAPNPEWASVTFGVLICMNCSGRHRGYGVQTSYVKSVCMDTWNHHQILSMMEGGNQQLQDFFDRHELYSEQRYFTKAGKFYKTHLSKHVLEISVSEYKGREANRRRRRRAPSRGGSCSEKLKSRAGQHVSMAPRTVSLQHY